MHPEMISKINSDWSLVIGHGAWVRLCGETSPRLLPLGEALRQGGLERSMGDWLSRWVLVSEEARSHLPSWGIGQE